MSAPISLLNTLKSLGYSLADSDLFKFIILFIIACGSASALSFFFNLFKKEDK